MRRSSYLNISVMGLSRNSFVANLFYGNLALFLPFRCLSCILSNAPILFLDELLSSRTNMLFRLHFYASTCFILMATNFQSRPLNSSQFFKCICFPIICHKNHRSYYNRPILSDHNVTSRTFAAKYHYFSTPKFCCYSHT